MLLNTLKIYYLNLSSFIKKHIAKILMKYNVKGVSLDKVYLSYLVFQNEDFDGDFSTVFFFYSSILLIYSSAHFLRSNDIVLGSILRFIAFLFLIIYFIKHIYFKMSWYKKEMKLSSLDPSLKEILFYALFAKTLFKVTLFVSLLLWSYCLLDESTRFYNERLARKFKTLN